MLPLIERFSGVIAILIAWIFVVFPAFKSGIKLKTDTITTSTSDKYTNAIISIGLILGALFQAWFLIYLQRIFRFNAISIGSVLYLTANLATILVALFTEKRNKLIHQLLVTYYFFACPLSLLFIGLSLEGHHNYLADTSFLIPIMYFFGQFLLWRKFKKPNTLMQMWAFVILSIWTLAMTFL
jgi:hypothetical protein